MKFRPIAIGIAVALLVPVVGHADEEKEADRVRVEQREQAREGQKHKDAVRKEATERKRVYGWELMSEEERAVHRKAMRNMKSDEDREAYRKAHHASMQERAKARGVELPDEPMERRRGAGAGGGQGRGRR